MNTDETTTDVSNDKAVSEAADTEGHGRWRGIEDADEGDLVGDDDTEAHLYVPKDERGGQDDTEGHGRFRH